VLKPLQDFLRLEAAGGLLLMGAAALALVVANSPLAIYYREFLDLPGEVRIGTFAIEKPLLLWVNDGQMAVFFLLVGLELKRELLDGHLSSVSRATLPALAALGGMIAPAAVYAWLNWSDAVAIQGWAIPTATDIAFALGVLSLLGPRVPAPLKAFLLSVAIFDDLGAVVVIALFHTADLSTLALALAAGFVLILGLLNYFKVTRISAYLLVGIALWVSVLKSGVHATLAGVVLAMFIPLRDPHGRDASPSRSLEHMLHPWVAFGILPLFAFVNAGVRLVGLTLADVAHAVPLGIAAGLFLGKQAGILATCWLAVRLRVAALPEGMTWKELHGVALLCGVGFTMSLFIASLAFEQGGGAYLGLDRLGILLGSLVSGTAGYVVLRLVLRRT
jgi:NhaA family Na+:H+ antiporter